MTEAGAEGVLPAPVNSSPAAPRRTTNSGAPVFHNRQTRSRTTKNKGKGKDKAVAPVIGRKRGRRPKQETTPELVRPIDYQDTGDTRKLLFFTLFITFIHSANCFTSLTGYKTWGRPENQQAAAIGLRGPTIPQISEESLFTSTLVHAARPIARVQRFLDNPSFPVSPSVSCFFCSISGAPVLFYFILTLIFNFSSPRPALIAV